MLRKPTGHYRKSRSSEKKDHFLKEQHDAINSLLQGNDVLAVLPTRFGRSAIYQNLLLAEDIRRASSSSVLVIVPPGSIIDEQLRSNDFGLKMAAWYRVSSHARPAKC